MLLLYSLAWEIDDAFGWLSGPVTVALTLSAPWVLIHSILAMLELPGLLASVATLQPKRADWYSWQNLVFYARSIALHYLASPLLAAGVAAGLIWAVVRWRRDAVFPVLLYGLLGLVMMTLEQSNNPRFILTVVPALYLLTGSAVAHLVAAWRERDQKWPRKLLSAMMLGLLLLAVVLGAVESFAVLPNLLTVEVETDPRAGDLAACVADRVQGEPAYYVNTWDQFSALSVEWYRATKRGRLDCCPGFRALPEKYLEPFAPQAAAALEQDIRASGAEVLVVMEGVDLLPAWLLVQDGARHAE